jgi:hypothetical protein
MKSDAFCIFEYDDNEETLVTFVYPAVDKETKTVIQETAHHLVTASNTLSLFSSFKGRFLYFEGTRNTDRSDNVRLYGVCVITEEINPPLFSAFAKLLANMACKTAVPANVLRVYLQILSQEEISQGGLEFSVDNYPEDYCEQCSFDAVLDRAGQFIPIIWQALVTGRSIAVYSPDITILQQVAVPLYCLCRPGKRPLLPLVLESSLTQTTSAQETPLAIWCSCDNAVLSGRFDLIVDISTRTTKISPAFAKEAGKCSLTEALMNTINDTTASEGNVTEAVEEFNQVIIDTLLQIKERIGELTAQSIGSVNLPADKKQLLIGMATSGVFDF